MTWTQNYDPFGQVIVSTLVAALPVAVSRAVRLVGTLATVGFPNIGLQGFAPKVLAHGHHGRDRVAVLCISSQAKPAKHTLDLSVH